MDNLPAPIGILAALAKRIPPRTPVVSAQLLIPASPGNNRLDSLENIVATGQAGLPFLIPGFDETAYLHCAKAFLRSRLWSKDALVDRSTLPTAGKMISDQTVIVSVPETKEQMERRYAPEL